MTAKPSFRLTCDGKSILAWLKWLYMTDLQEPHADFLSATQTLIQHSAVIINGITPCKSHQDSSQFRPFTQDSTLNIEADQQARTKLTPYTLVLPSFCIPWSQGVCYMGSDQVEENFGRTLHDHINGQATKVYQKMA